MNVKEKYVKAVDDAIEMAESSVNFENNEAEVLGDNIKLTKQQFDLEGMSSPKVRIFLNELVGSPIIQIVNYLEVGVYRGSTFISSLYKNRINKAYAVDNFSQFNGDEKIFRKNCSENSIEYYEFINENCFNLTLESKSKLKDINIYFYDGEHREIDQEMALTYYSDCMAGVFIYIADDWNHSGTRAGTPKGIAAANLKIVKSWELEKTPDWWNGLYIAVCEK